MKPDDKPEKPPHEKYSYFVDDVKYEWNEPTITGKQIKDRIPGLDPTYGLTLEGHGNDADTPIQDGTVVSLEKEKGPKRFYTAPSGTFGAQ
jgi:hypothetical protein